MKSFKKYQLLALSLFIGATLTTSCETGQGGDDPQPPTPPEVVDPETPTESEAMDVAEQKNYLDQVATEVINEMDSYDFAELVEFGDYISYTYEDYDFDDVAEWASEIFEDLIEPLNTTTIEKDQWTTYFYNNYKAVIMASNFKSHFTAKKYRWVRTDADDLQFIFKDDQSQECVLKLTTSGTTTKVHVSNVDDWYDYDYDSSTGRYIEYYDRIQMTIGVPEQITLSLTRGNANVFKVVMDIDLASIVSNEFDLSRSQLNMSVSTEFGNGYKFVISQAAYSPSKVSASFTVLKNGQMLINAITSSNIEDIPSLKMSETEEVFDEFENIEAKNAYFKFDVLGKVQMQGTIEDARKYAEYLAEADDNYDHERAFKSYINQANALADINLFYDGSATKQATISLEAFEDYSYGGVSYWVAEPIITFYDGSSYNTFGEFFNKIDFKKTIRAFENMIESYEDMIY